MRRHLRPLILILTLLMAVAACGDDDFGGDFGDTQATNAPGLGDDGFGDDQATLPTSVGDIPGISDECQAIFDLSLAMSSAFTGGLTGFDADIVANLPPDMQADGAIIVGALQDFSDGLQAAGIDLSQGVASLSQEQLQTFSELGESVFNDEVDAAFERLGEMASEDCAITDDF